VRRRFSPRRLGDRIAPLGALALVVGLAYGGSRLLEMLGWELPWSRSEVTSREGPRSRGDPANGQARPTARPEPTTREASLPPASEPDVRDDESGGDETASPPDVSQDDVGILRARQLELPVEGLDRDTLRSDFGEARGSHLHEAIDLLAPRGQPVMAVEDGTIEKLFTSVRGGLTIYQFDPSRSYAYYYAHLDGYVRGLHEGQPVERGQVIGYVGTTGNAPEQTPHLHFAIFKLGPERRWWHGTAIDPFLVLR
jgi:murein DD-endopeptidase MepM/ murein hydrolase activator NlpD